MYVTFGASIPHVADDAVYSERLSHTSFFSVAMLALFCAIFLAGLLTNRRGLRRQTNTRQCPYCGAENDEARAACHGCGTSLPAVGVPDLAASPPQPSRSLRGAALMVAVLAFLGALVFATLHAKQIGANARRIDTIDIRGTKKFADQVASALNLLKTKSPYAYEMVTNYIGLIEQSEHSGMAANLTPPTVKLNARSAFYSVTWCAADLAHESFHSKLFHDYRRDHPSSGWVPDDVWTGESAEKRCCEHQFRVLKELDAPFYEISTSLWNPSNRYWEVPYGKRDW